MEKYNSGNDTLSRTELLAINYIYYFDMTAQFDVRSHLRQLKENVLSSIIKDLDQTEFYDALSPEIVEFCNIFEEVCNFS